MTDITELAQRVKTEVSAIDDTQWYLAKPSEIRLLVEALEKAQKTIAFQQGEIKALLSSLESRTVTVKLASRRLPSDYADDEFGNEDLAAIHNACRLECKVSVEKYLSAHGIAVKWEAE